MDDENTILVEVNLFLTINLWNAYMENNLYNWRTLSLGDNKIIFKKF